MGMCSHGAIFPRLLTTTTTTTTTTTGGGGIRRWGSMYGDGNMNSRLQHTDSYTMLTGTVD